MAQANLTYEEWVEEITNSLANKMSISTSDAQALVGTQQFEIDNAWNLDLSAIDAAESIAENLK
ncbi:hypothetical protein [Neptuniibacter sp. QD37_11]|uniref:hypothetical protein n=1 Tax=Neptuniibacter sp. QD37_11 TaxID=3398209 RepID=UPI0039F5165C